MYSPKFSKSVLYGLGLSLSLTLTCCKVPNVVAMESGYECATVKRLNSIVDFWFSGKEKEDVEEYLNSIVDFLFSGKEKEDVIALGNDDEFKDQEFNDLEIVRVLGVETVERLLKAAIFAKFGVYFSESKFEKLLRGSKRLLMERIIIERIIDDFSLRQIKMPDDVRVSREFPLVNFDCVYGCENKGDVSKMLFIMINGVRYSLCEKCKEVVLQSAFTRFAPRDDCNKIDSCMDYRDEITACEVCCDEAELRCCGKCKYVICSKCLQRCIKCPRCRKYDSGKLNDKDFFEIAKPDGSSIGALYRDFVNSRLDTVISLPSEDFTIRKRKLDPQNVLTSFIAEHNRLSSSSDQIQADNLQKKKICDKKLRINL